MLIYTVTTTCSSSSLFPTMPHPAFKTILCRWHAEFMSWLLTVPRWRCGLSYHSSSSFISERLVQGLGLRQSRSDITVSGVAGLGSSSLSGLLSLSLHILLGWCHYLSSLRIVSPLIYHSNQPIDALTRKNQSTQLDQVIKEYLNWGMLNWCQVKF